MLKGYVLPVVALALGAHCAAAPLAFSLRDTRGAAHTAAEWRGDKAVVLFFVTTDCPVANSYVPEMNRIRDAYAGRGVGVYAVQADASVTAAEAAKYAEEYRYRFPLLVDAEQVLVKWTGATITPQAAVLSADGRVLYLGRIDNRVADFGKARQSATSEDLRIALDAVLAGRAVPVPRTKSIGCAINLRK
ncbi:MAG TPA: redoxin domain-containing protein [Candidatus Limnocylindrales bacterium]|nr:redoxin domain-containing protein [Candidatus Limnocylindrales bacterium]